MQGQSGDPMEEAPTPTTVTRSSRPFVAEEAPTPTTVTRSSRRIFATQADDLQIAAHPKYRAPTTP